MKKNYLTSFIVLLGSVAILNAATTPQQGNKNDVKGSKTNVASVNNQELKQTAGSSASHLVMKNISSSNTTNFVCSPTIFTDNFDGLNDTSSLQARGYKTYFRGGGVPGTSPTWFNGNPLVFSAFNGPADGYVGSNFNSVTGANNIDNGLILPALNVSVGDFVSFYSQSPAGSTIPDSIKVMYSPAGDSVPEALTWVLLGEFKVNVNGVWEFKSFNIPTASATGRIAIRYAVVDGGPTGANSDYIGIDQLDVASPTVDDAKLLAITSPVSACVLSAAESVSVSIVNVGSDSLPSSFDVAFSIDGGTPVVETASALVGPGDTLLYTFTGTADLSVIGAHTVQAYTLIGTDGNQCNDSALITVSSFTPDTPLTTLYSMGFELTEDFSDWVVEDGNADATFWDPIDVNPHSGTFCMRKPGSGSPDNDWLFTSCLSMTGGASYTLDYWYKVFELTTPCEMEAFIGSAQNAASMTQLLISNPIPTDTIYQHAINVFTVPNNGTYSIGFHAFSAAGSSSIRLDDINLDDGTFIGINKVENSVVNVYPNPTIGFFALHSPATVKDATVEVFDMNGQLVYSNHVGLLSHLTVDLSKYSNGVYNVRVTSNTTVENHRVVVNK